MHIIDLIYSIHAMHQLIYELEVSTLLIVEQCFIIRIVLIQCIGHVIGHLYIRTIAIGMFFGCQAWSSKSNEGGRYMVKKCMIFCA